MTIKRLLLLAVLLGGLLVGCAPAQDTDFPASLSHFRFNFLNPGARAAGMGGAFIAQGNDATGSETNPAGLMFIPKPIVFGEYRYFRNTVNRAYDADSSQVLYRNFTDSVHSPVFISVVYPTKKWAFAFYRQELANFKIHFSSNDYVVPNGPDPNQLYYVINRQSINLDFHLTNYGFSIARKLHETFALGFSVRLAHMDFTGHEYVNLDPDRTVPTHFPDLSVYTTASDNISNYTQIADSDWRVSFVGGFQYKPNDYVSLAAVYRYGEKHKLQATFFNDVYLPGQISLKKEYSEFSINVPDRLGVGVSVMPNSKLTFNFDVVEIFYSDLNDQFRQILATNVQQYFGWENGTEYRLGGEYSIPIGKTNSVSLRAGYYNAPDPSMHYLGGASATSGTAVIGPLLFPNLGNIHHGTFGGGFVVGKMQIDVAGDLSKDKNYFALSAMYSF